MRRLPVIQQASNEDQAAAERPRWQWCLIGAGLTVTIWAPIAVIAVPFGAVPLLVSYGVAAGLAGALVGRFGGRSRPREAAVSGVLAAFLVTSVAALGGSGLSTLGILLAMAALAAVGASFGFVGAGFGVRRRAVLDSPR
jgi:hypothetical protein